MNRLPLSLLDLLACGFGSVILLFFVTIIVWEEIAAQTSQAPMSNSSGFAPFVLLIIPADDQQPLFENASQAVWTCATKEKSFQFSQDQTTKYTVFYSNQVPQNADMVLEGAAPGVKVIANAFIQKRHVTLERNTDARGSVVFNAKDF